MIKFKLRNTTDDLSLLNWYRLSSHIINVYLCINFSRYVLFYHLLKQIIAPRNKILSFFDLLVYEKTAGDWLCHLVFLHEQTNVGGSFGDRQTFRIEIDFLILACVCSIFASFFFSKSFIISHFIFSIDGDKECNSERSIVNTKTKSNRI